VLNASRKIVVRISARDIRTGKNKDPGSCAAARALIREVPNCVAARVHLGRTYLQREDKTWLRYRTPEALRTEIIAFDRGGRFEPGEYELRPLSPADRGRRHVKKAAATAQEDPRHKANKTPRKLHVAKGVRKRGANR
jgi:hypothetical protein